MSSIRQAQKCGGVKIFNGMQTLSILIIIGSPMAT